MRSLSSEQPGLRACLEAMRLRPCRLCGTSDDGVFGRCVERYRQVPRLLVVARGAQQEIALVPVAWDGLGEVGCPDPGAVVLLRTESLCAGDAAADDAMRAVGGRLTAAGSFEDPHAKGLIRGAAMVVAWDVARVYPAVDGGVLWETPRPLRTFVDPAAPRYGRWPAPWLPWASVADMIPWSERPFRHRARHGARGLPQDAFAAVGLPPVGAGSHPVAKAVALAALLRSVPWDSGRKTLGARILPPEPPVMAVVGVCRGEVYRLARDCQWERLFASGEDDRVIGLREIELAEGHMRMADAWNSASGDGIT